MAVGWAATHTGWRGGRRALRCMQHRGRRCCSRCRLTTLDERFRSGVWAWCGSAAVVAAAVEVHSHQGHASICIPGANERQQRQVVGVKVDILEDHVAPHDVHQPFFASIARDS
eukprot:575515-Prymnesium_polylepis.2